MLSIDVGICVDSIFSKLDTVLVFSVLNSVFEVVDSNIGIFSLIWGVGGKNSSDEFVIEGYVVSFDRIKSFSVNVIVVWGGGKVVPDVSISVALNVVEVVGLRVVVVIQAFRLQERSSDGAPKQGLPFGPFAATAKKRLRF